MYQFCKEFGWTILEFYDQPFYDLRALSIVMEEVAQQQKREHDKAKAKSTSRGGGRRFR